MPDPIPKPYLCQDVLVTPDNRLKVTNFEFARTLATIIPGEHTDIVWGSPPYFSPEQAGGHAPSPASDVYSLGIVLYEMLTGTFPFTGSTAEELARLHLNANPIPPSEYTPDIPKALEEIILKVLSKEPSARYRTADQLGRVLMKFAVQDEIKQTVGVTSNEKHIDSKASTKPKVIQNKQSRSTSTPPDSLNIFLCHSNADKPIVRGLFRDLKNSSEIVKPWLDEEDIIPGQNWELEIENAIQTTDIVLVCLSNNSVNKIGFVNKEIKIALDFADRQPEGTIFIIPIRLDEVAVPNRLKHLQWVDFNKNAGYKHLFRAIEFKAKSIGIDLDLMDKTS